MAEDQLVGNSYRLIRPIGQGATGTVWRGEHHPTSEPVAVKLLHESLLRQPRLVTRFVQERTILLMLRHPNVVRVRDLFSVGETLALVMDLVDGGNLRDHLHRDGTMPPAEAARLAAQIAAALAEAHELGVIHRDLKPDNVLLDGDGQTRLTDFGIARILTLPSMTTPNAVVGTPHYMAPEAFHGTTPSAATDVYALGVLLYELVCGRPPYRSDSIPELMRLHAEGKPERRDGIPDPLWRIVTECLSGKPRLRPSAAELVTDLTALAASLRSAPALPRAPAAEPEVRAEEAGPRKPPVPGPRRRPGRDAPAGRWSRRGAIAALTVGAMLVSAIATTAWHLNRQDDENPEAAPTIAVAPSVPPLARAAPRSGAPRPPADRSGRQHRAAKGVALPASQPKTAAVRAKRPAPARTTARSPLPEGGARGPWQCAQGLVFDLPSRTAVGPRPCHSTGRDVRFQGSLTAPAGGRARVEVTLRDAATGRTVAGPTTCDLRFTRQSFIRGCGPAAASPRRGRTYTVVMSYRYVRDGRSFVNTARGHTFTW
ncbi:serine/threonine-protein kinase [Actinoplanes lobatus]|uniref:Serine/threonine-protein kinase n=1 Tax=Actinoplanes lobatus TaxID=113568 RepID=A0A7W7MDG3_9ACTN|nr:serine/threonine-protein kinase [Actinoplanes lobatus]MBB4746206.1 serine/threonine-protein kinase [Actinoplanes lobatus]